jgi:hypothetical protein
MPVLAGCRKKVVNTPMHEFILLAIGLPDRKGIGLPLNLTQITPIPGLAGDVADIAGIAPQARVA